MEGGLQVGDPAAFVRPLFGGVPQSILYDNDKRLVARILPDGTRQRTQAFSGLQSHYLFEDCFGNYIRQFPNNS